MKSIKLSHVPSSYPPSEGVVVRAEVLPRVKREGSEVPGLYFQFVDGCGYTIYEFTPDEAEAIGKQLIVGAKQSRKSFAKKA